jgi:hypothetical protein
VAITNLLFELFSALLYVRDCALRDGNIVPLKYFYSIFIFLGCVM